MSSDVIDGQFSYRDSRELSDGLWVIGPEVNGYRQVGGDSAFTRRVGSRVRLRREEHHMTMTTGHRRSEDDTVRGAVPSWKLGSEGADEGELEPLGVPAVVLSGVLICAGLVALAWLPSLAAEYGGPLPVGSIVALHVLLSAALGIWGIGQRRRR
ncbi:hypothetical protein ACFC06_02375 [Nocardia sp. NPDC056064]|uniref:hypothetical protein n=1 Tax=Nocardia sp. NPDC056064 TaxID=3345701 RepID=UPI0035DB9EB4